MKHFVRATFNQFHSILDIDDCACNPCKHNGICIDGVNGFTCNCTVGFIGKKCETGELDINAL